MTNTAPCVARVFFFFNHKHEPFPILSATTLRTPPEPGQGLFQLKMKYHSKPHVRQSKELVQNYVARLNLHKKAQKKQL